MSDAWGFEEDLNENEGSDNIENTGPKPLRDAYKALKDKNKALEDRLLALEEKATKDTVASSFKNLGVDPSLASQYKGDTTPEAVKAWVDNMRAAFGGTASQSTESAPTQGLDADTQRQYSQMSDAGTDGTPLGNADAAMASIKDAKSVDDILAAWKRLG